MLEITKSSITFATFTSRISNKDFLVQEGFLHPKMHVAKLYPNSTHLGFFFSFASRLTAQNALTLMKLNVGLHDQYYCQ